MGEVRLVLVDNAPGMIELPNAEVSRAGGAIMVDGPAERRDVVVIAAVVAVVAIVVVDVAESRVNRAAVVRVVRRGGGGLRDRTALDLTERPAPKPEVEREGYRRTPTDEAA